VTGPDDPSGDGAGGVLVDARGLLCPVPVIRLAAALRTSPCALLLADDPAARLDVPAWCRMKGATLLGVSEVAAAEPGSRGWQRYQVQGPA
jgi:tRNA 2-thiouridine synthesizing protein A